MSQPNNDVKVFAMDWQTRHSAFVAGIEEFGRLVPIYNGRINIHALAREQEQVMQLLRAEGYDPASDYLAIVGSPIAATVVTAAATRLACGQDLRLLVFDAVRQAYRHQTLPTGRPDTGLDQPT